MNLTLKSLIDASGCDLSDSDAARSRKISAAARTLAVLSAIAAVLCAAAYFTRIPHGALAVPALLILLLALYQITLGAKKRTVSILFDKCDPEGFLKKYLTYAASGVFGSEWDEHFFNVSAALYSAGRFDEGRKVLSLFEKLDLNEKGRFRLALAKAFYAYEEGDAEELDSALYAAKVERQKIDTTGQLEDMYREAEDLPVMLSVIIKRDYKMGFEAFASGPDKKGSSEYRSNLSKVRYDHFLLTLAKGMEDDYLIKRYSDEIKKIGGTTWYRKEVEN